jgi:hypothetical protein
MCAEKKEEEKPIQKRIKGNPPLKEPVTKPPETTKIIKTVPGKKTS